MREYQTAIANNLWKELDSAFQEANDNPDKYDTIFLDRSPLDAYIYEELYGAISLNNRYIKSVISSIPDVTFRAFNRFFQEYNERNIQKTYAQKLYLIGLTSLFESNDPKRPPMEINQKYANEVRKIFTMGSVVNNYPLLIMRALPNTRLDLSGRALLLNNILQEN